MSNKQELTEGTRGDIKEVEKEKMEEFFQHLIKHSQARQLFYVGSSEEIDGQGDMFEQHGLNADDLIDSDVMQINTVRRAFSLRHAAPEMYYHSVMRIYSPGHHSGYVKLITELDHIEFKLSEIAGDTVGIRHGPADSFSAPNQGQQLMQGYPQVSTESWITNQDNAIAMQDHVYAVHSPYWPVEATEWITRPRLHGLPSNSTIKDVVRCGCDFVQVSHKLSIDDNEWRFSFSRAELLIISNWTTSQRIVYRALHLFSKLIKSRVDDSKLCTYYIKTLMLWATEERPASFWSEDVLVNSVCQLFCELIQWLKGKSCANYFIPSNNMMDHLTNTDLSADIDALCRISQSEDLIVDVLYQCRRVEIFYSSRMRSIAAPKWLYTSLIISEKIDFGYYKQSNKFFLSDVSTHMGLQDAFSFQLLNIYNGINFHRDASNCIVLSNGNNYMHNSIRNLRNCLIPSLDTAAQPCSKTIACLLLPTWFLHEPDAHEVYSLFSHSRKADDEGADQKCLLYIQSMNNVKINNIQFHTSSLNRDNISIALYRTSTVDDETATDVEFYKKFSGMSPTVGISWFTKTAYLANLYYAAQRYYSAAEEMCDSIIIAYELSAINQEFAENSLPVILSTEWISVYDEEVQAMLGLYSLCLFMFNKTDRSRSVYLGVCSVQYALYLKCRCAGSQLLADKWNICFDDYYKHSDACNCHIKVCNGGLLMNSAINVTAEAFDRVILLIKTRENSTRIF